MSAATALQVPPPGVPATARVTDDGHWIDGDPGAGYVRMWLPDGVLVREEHRVRGVLHGVVTTYDPATGALAERVTYVDGAKYGPYLRRPPAGTFADPRIVFERGSYGSPDQHTGLYEYLDLHYHSIARVDTGSATEVGAVERVCDAPIDRLRELATELAGARATGASVLGWLRHAANGGDAEPLRRLLAAIALPLSSAERARRAAAFAPKPCLISLLDAIRGGGDVPALLHASATALDHARASELAHELIEGALLLAPERHDYELTRALIRMSLGDVDGVDASIRQLRDTAPDKAGFLAVYRAALFPTWNFWPATDSRVRVAEQIAPLLAVAPASPVSIRAIQEAATRLHVFRARLLEAFGDQLWIVPSVTHLLPDGPLAIAVPDDCPGIGAQHLARRDWQRLGLLCWCAGLDTFALPAPGHTPRPRLPLSLVGLARLALLAGDEPDLVHALRDVVHPDRAAAVSAVIATRARQTTWFGASIVGLPETLAELAIADELALTFE